MYIERELTWYDLQEQDEGPRLVISSWQERGKYFVSRLQNLPTRSPLYIHGTSKSGSQDNFHCHLAEQPVIDATCADKKYVHSTHSTYGLLDTNYTIHWHTPNTSDTKYTIHGSYSVHLCTSTVSPLSASTFTMSTSLLVLSFIRGSICYVWVQRVRRQRN